VGLCPVILKRKRIGWLFSHHELVVPPSRDIVVPVTPPLNTLPGPLGAWSCPEYIDLFSFPYFSVTCFLFWLAILSPVDDRFCGRPVLPASFVLPRGLFLGNFLHAPAAEVRSPFPAGCTGLRKPSGVFFRSLGRSGFF